MGRFGETAEDYELRHGDDDEVWVRGFRAGDTTIRILQPTKDWIVYKEHYSEDVQAFHPCPEDGTCPGCASDSERTRKKTRKYAVNCLDSEGTLRIFKFGGRQYRQFKGREERSGSVVDRDYTIIKSGTGLQTTYDADPGDKYKIDNVPDLVDIIGVLEASYDRALKLYEAGGEVVVEEELEEEAPPARPRIGAAKKAVAPPEKKAAAAPAAKKAVPPARKAAAKVVEPEPEEEAEEEAEETAALDFEEMSTKEIKAWLEEQGVEYPETAVRSRIIALAKGYEI